MRIDAYETPAAAARTAEEQETEFLKRQRNREKKYGIRLGETYTIMSNEHDGIEEHTKRKPIRVRVAGLYRYFVSLEKQNGLRLSLSYRDFKVALQEAEEHKGKKRK